MVKHDDKYEERYFPILSIFVLKLIAYVFMIAQQFYIEASSNMVFSFLMDNVLFFFQMKVVFILSLLFCIIFFFATKNSLSKSD